MNKNFQINHFLILLFTSFLLSTEFIKAESAANYFIGTTEQVDYNLYDYKPFTGSKQTLLISDIDDTIKVSHVLNPALATIRSFDSSTPFAGMASLYQLIVNENPQQTEVFYLSNAPEEIVGTQHFLESHQLFVQLNKFPDGSLILRKSLLDKNHKVNAIRFLIQKYQPQKVILVGDNGEKDNELYQVITSDSQYKQIQFKTYIHMLYSTQAIIQKGKFPLFQQKGYVTPVEIAMDLNHAKWLKAEALDWMFRFVAPRAVDEGVMKIDIDTPVYFPYFMNCRDFKYDQYVLRDNAEKKWIDFLNKKCVL